MLISSRTVSILVAATQLNVPISSIKLVVLSAWVSRLAAAAAMMFSVRVLSNSLTPADYATFIVIGGLIGWFALGDFGLGYAIQNTVTNKTSARDSAASEILSAYAMLLVMTSIIAIALFVFKDSIANLLFAKIAVGNAKGRADVFLHSSLLLIVAASAAISTKILYGMQRGYISNITATLAAGIGLAILSAGINSVDDKVTYAVFALYGPNALICCIFCAVQIIQALRARYKFSSSIFRELAKSSRGFFVFYFVAAAILQIDYLVMSQKVASTEIIQYYTLAKVFSFVSFFNQAILFAAWPKMTAQFGAGTLSKIRALLMNLVLSSGVVTLLATVVILVAKEQLATLIAPGTPLQLRTAVILGFGAVAFIRCLTDPFAIFLQSIGRLRPLIFFAAIQAIIAAPLQWFLAGRLGVEGILLALILSFVFTAAWGLPYNASKILQGSASASADSIAKH